MQATITEEETDEADAAADGATVHAVDGVTDHVADLVTVHVISKKQRRKGLSQQWAQKGVNDGKNEDQERHKGCAVLIA